MASSFVKQVFARYSCPIMKDFDYYERMVVMDIIWSTCNFIVVMFEICGLVMLFAGLLGAVMNGNMKNMEPIGTIWRLICDCQDNEDLYDF